MDSLSNPTTPNDLLRAFGEVVTVTTKAVDIAKSLAQIENGHESVAVSLEGSFTIVERFSSLTETIRNTIPDEQLRSLNVPLQTLTDHVEITQALIDSLERRRKGLEGDFRPFLAVPRNIPTLNPALADIDRHCRIFVDSLTNLSLFLNILQTSVVVTPQQLVVPQRSQHVASVYESTTVSPIPHSGQGHAKNEPAGSPEGFAQKTTASVSSTLQAIDDHIETFATKQPSAHVASKCFQVPYPANRYFTGREPMLAQISAHLLGIDDQQRQLEAGPKLFGIHGLPGIGKTHLALQFAYNHRNHYSHVFWIASDSVDKLDLGVVNTARALGLSDPNAIEDKDRLLELVIAWLKEPFSRLYHNWLVIFDNVDDFKLLYPIWAELKHGSILVTSRDIIQGIECLDIVSRCHSLGPLSIAEGTDMMKRRLGAKIPEGSDDSTAADLARHFGYYPLYMDHMASFLQAYPMPLRHFIQQLDSEPSDHDLQNLSVDSPWYVSSVADAIKAHISKLDASTRLVLAVLAFFDPDQIPQRLLLPHQKTSQLFSSGLQCQLALYSLYKCSFIQLNDQTDPGDMRISMHRLVRDAALRSCTSLQVAFNHATTLLRCAFPLQNASRAHMVEDWTECEAFQSHVLALHLRYLELRETQGLQLDFGAVDLFYSCAWYTCERGRLATAEQLISTILKDIEDPKMTLITDVPAVFHADLHAIQLMYHNENVQGVSMIDLANSEIRIREEAVANRLMDSFHPCRANGYMNLGVALSGKDAQTAVELHAWALDIRLGSERYAHEQLHCLALNYLNIGRCSWLVKRFEDAEVYLKKCHDIMTKREAEVGKQFPITAWALFSLGIIRAENGDNNTALQLLTESLNLQVTTLGDTHLKTLACYYRVAWACHRLGELKRAEHLLRMILKSYSSLAPVPAAEVARTKFKLAEVLRDQTDNDDESASLFEEAKRALADIIRGDRENEYTEEDFDGCVVWFLR